MPPSRSRPRRASWLNVKAPRSPRRGSDSPQPPRLTGRDEARCNSAPPGDPSRRRWEGEGSIPRCGRWFCLPKPQRDGGHPLLPWLLAEELAIAFREMRRRNEAACERHVKHGQVCLLQQEAGAAQPDLEVMSRRRTLQVFPEQPFELPGGQLRIARELCPAQRLLDILFHKTDHRDQLRMANAKACRQRHALMIMCVPNALVDELVRDGRGELMAVLRCDQVQHQI